MRSILTFLVVNSLLVGGSIAQDKGQPKPQQRKRNSYPPELAGATVETYKKIDDVEMKLWIFKPKGHKATDERPAAIFFFGGGWRNGSPQQFEQHCRYLAKRGMVAITADYRVSSRHGVKARACVEDGKSAVRWVRENATKLGVDPNRIVAGGGSAGGHVAACTGVLRGFEIGNTRISSKPNALVLFNPALVLAENPGFKLKQKLAATLNERMGVDAAKLSPWHHVNGGEPPTIIFHGRADETVPYKSADMFAQRMKKNGSHCVLKGYAGQGHGFFNYGRNKNEMYKRTVREMDNFLVSLKYIDPVNDR